MKMFQKIGLLVAVFFVLNANSFAQKQANSTPAEKKRPVIALVLSGGGAKGLAEIPLLEALEDEGIPIDMVLGTSMGSMVGSLYAAGYSPKEIRNIVETTDMMHVILEKTSETQRIPKEPFCNYDNLASIPFSRQGIGGAPALLGDQRIYDFLSTHFVKLNNIKNFDDLPKKFRCVATNVLTGKPIIFSEGSLINAVRCSMSIPMIFTPAAAGNGQYAVDGGMVDNLPIKVARDMGADIVIAMDVASIMKTKVDDILGVDDMAIHMFNLLISTGAVEQYEMADLMLKPDMGNYNTLDFMRGDGIIKVGEDCVSMYKKELHQLARKIESMGVELEFPYTKRESLYAKMPDPVVEKVVIKDISFMPPCPLPNADEFKAFLDKPLDEKNIKKLSIKLEDLRFRFNLSTLAFETTSGSTPEKCTLVIMANHYVQSNNELVFGGLPTMMVSNSCGKNHFNIYPDFNFGVKFIEPIGFNMNFGMGEQNFASFSLLPHIATFKNDYKVNFEVAAMGQFGSLEPANSLLNNERTVNNDFNVHGRLGFDFSYIDYAKYSIGVQYDCTMLNSNPDPFHMAGIYTKLLVNTMKDEVLQFSGFRYEGLLCGGLNITPEKPEIIWKAEFLASNAFEFVHEKTSLAINARAATVRYPSELTAGYFEYGGFSGMCGYPYGTYQRDMAVLGVTFHQHLFNFLGMPVVGILQGKAGVKDTYDAFAKTGNIAGPIPFSSMDWKNFDLGYAAYVALKTPVGNVILGGGQSITGRYVIMVGFN